MEDNNSQGLYPAQPEAEEKSSFDIKTLYTIVILNWKWFLLSAIICLSAAAIYLRYTTPMYQAYVKLLIKDDDSGGRTSRNKSSLMASSTLGIMSNSAGIDNEMEILSSSIIAEQTVKSLKLYVDYKMEGRVKDHLMYNNQPISVDLDANNLENLKQPIFLTIKNEKGKFHIAGSYTYVPKDQDKAPVPYTIDRVVDRLPLDISTSVGRISFRRNAASPLPEGKTLFATIYPARTMAMKYAGALSVSQTSKTTTIAEAVLTDEIPQRAIDYLNQLVISYNTQANADKNEIAMRTERFINNRLEKINTELGATEGNIESTKRRYRIVDPRINSAQSVANSDAYTQKLAEMNMQLELLRSLSNYMNEPSNKYQTLPSNVGLNDPASSSLINSYNQIVLERNRLLRSASENSPSVVPLTAQLDELASSIRRAMVQAQRNAEIQRNTIQQQYNMYSGQILSTPEQERVLNQIGRQQEVKSGLYLMLLQKREENSISLAATADKCNLSDEPRMIGQISPESSMIMMIALIMGLASPAVGLCLVKGL